MGKKAQEVAAAAVAGAGILLLAQLAKAATEAFILELEASATAVVVGQEITMTVIVLDTSKQPLEGVAPALLVNGAPVESFSQTGAAGTSSLLVSFTQTGKFDLEAQL